MFCCYFCSRHFRFDVICDLKGNVHSKPLNIRIRYAERPNVPFVLATEGILCMFNTAGLCPMVLVAVSLLY